MEKKEVTLRYLLENGLKLFNLPIVVYDNCVLNQRKLLELPLDNKFIQDMEVIAIRPTTDRAEICVSSYNFRKANHMTRHDFVDYINGVKELKDDEYTISIDIETGGDDPVLYSILENIHKALIGIDEYVNNSIVLNVEFKTVLLFYNELTKETKEKLFTIITEHTKYGNGVKANSTLEIILDKDTFTNILSSLDTKVVNTLVSTNREIDTKTITLKDVGYTEIRRALEKLFKYSEYLENMNNFDIALHKNDSDIYSVTFETLISNQRMLNFIVDGFKSNPINISKYTTADEHKHVSISVLCSEQESNAVTRRLNILKNSETNRILDDSIIVDVEFICNSEIVDKFVRYVKSVDSVDCLNNSNFLNVFIDMDETPIDIFIKFLEIVEECNPNNLIKELDETANESDLENPDGDGFNFIGKE